MKRQYKFIFSLLISTKRLKRIIAITSNTLKSISFLFIVLFICNCKSSSQPQLELLSIRQINYNEPFELSGLAQNHEYGILLIADNKNSIYKIDTLSWEITKFRKMKIPANYDKFDTEGVDISNGNIYVVEERSAAAFLVDENGTMNKLIIDYTSYQAGGIVLSPENWKNAGLEGIAVNSNKNLLFIAKERKTKKNHDSRFILVVDLNNNGKIIDKINFDENIKNADFSDIKYLKKNNTEYLYILQRNECILSRIDLKDKKIIKFSFSDYLKDSFGNQNLYNSDKSGHNIAEALIIRDNEIWIGVDNNDEEIITSNKYAQKYHLKGRQPVILIFKRPKDF